MNDNPSPTHASGTSRVAWWALACAIVALLVGLVALLVAAGADDAAAPANSAGAPPTLPVPPSTATTPPATNTTVAPATSSPSVSVSAPTTSTSTTTSEPSTTMLPPTTVPDEVSPVVWPRHDSNARYADPVAAARTFAVEFIGFDPVVVGEFLAGDSRSGDVEIRSRPNGSPTVVHVRQVDGDDWAVIGASNANITIAQPVALAEIESPMVLTGTASAFEGTVQVRLYSDGSDEPVVAGFVTGSGGPEAGPFADVFEWNAATAEGATLLLFSTSPEDDSIVDATTLRLRFHAVTV